MRWVVCVLLLSLMGGCAETPVPEDVDDMDTDPAGSLGNATGLAGRLVAVLASPTAQAGVPFNVTLDYVDDNATDASALPWQATFTDNTGNTTSYNGTGLPATFVANLTVPGNTTLTASVGTDDAVAVLEPVLLWVDAPAVADPCLDAVVQEPVSASGSTLLPGDVGVHDIDVGPCQTLIHVAVDILIGGDMDYYLFDPSGAQKDSSAAFGAEGIASESDLHYEEADGLAVGTWRVEIENFASLATDYDMTVTFA